MKYTYIITKTYTIDTDKLEEYNIINGFGEDAFDPKDPYTVYDALDLIKEEELPRVSEWYDISAEIEL